MDIPIQCVVRDCKQVATSVPTLIVRHAPAHGPRDEVTLDIPLCDEHAPMMSLQAVLALARWSEIAEQYETMHGVRANRRWCGLRMSPVEDARPLRLADHIERTPSVAVHAGADVVNDAMRAGLPVARCANCGALYVVVNGFGDRCPDCHASRTGKREGVKP